MTCAAAVKIDGRRGKNKVKTSRAVHHHHFFSNPEALNLDDFCRKRHLAFVNMNVNELKVLAGK